MIKQVWSFGTSIQIEVEDFMLANEIFDKFTQGEKLSDEELSKIIIIFDREQAILITLDPSNENQKPTYRAPTNEELKLINNMTLDPKLAGISNRSIDRRKDVRIDKESLKIKKVQENAFNDVKSGKLIPDESKCIMDDCPYIRSRKIMKDGGRIIHDIPTCHLCGLTVNHGIY